MFKKLILSLVIFAGLSVSAQPGEINVSSLNLVPNSPSAGVMNRSLLQSSIDSIPDNAKFGTTYYFPEGQWYIDPGVWLDKNNIEFRGDSQSRSIISMPNNYDGSNFFAGMRRDPNYLSDRYIDLFNKLDSSIAPRQGTSWGYRIGPDAHITQNAGPFQYGNGNFFADQSKLSIAFAWEGPVPQMSLFGMCRPGGVPDPFFVHHTADVPSRQPGSTILFVGANDGTSYGVKTYMIRFPYLNNLDAGIHRMVIETDLAAGTAFAWIDGKSVPARLPADFLPDPARKFASSQNFPFNVGISNEGASAVKNSQYSGDANALLNICGLKITLDNLYTGDTLTRIDGKVINDKLVFATKETNLLGYLGLSDNPTIAIPNHRVTINTNNTVSYGIFATKNQPNPYWAVSNLSMHDLSIDNRNSNGVTGEALTLGISLSTKLTNVSLYGKTNGLGSWGWGPNYMTTLSNVSAWGRNACIYNYKGILNIDKSEMIAVGNPRYGIYNFAGNIAVKNVFIAFADECAIKTTFAGIAAIENLMVDTEDNKHPTDSFIFSHSSSYLGTNAGGLIIRNLNLGNIKPGSPLVRLVGVPNGAKNTQFQMDGLLWGGNGASSTVWSDGNWMGEMSIPKKTYPPLTGTDTGIKINVRGEVPVVPVTP